MRSHRISKLLACALLTVTLAATITEEIGEDFAASRETRGPRCEHHDHDGKRPTKWLGKLKRTKTQYASSKPNSRPKSHYGQPHIHNRPPKPQYIPTTTNFRIPPYNPPASYRVPHLSHSAVQNNPNSLQQPSYFPLQNSNKLPQAPYPLQKNPNLLPQPLSFDPPAYVSPASVEAPSYAPHSFSSTPYPESSEDFEDLSLPMSVYTPPAQVYNPPHHYHHVQLPVKGSDDSPVTSHTHDPNYLPAAYSPSAHPETTTSPLPSYTESTSVEIHSPTPPAYDPPIAGEAETLSSPSSSQIPVHDPQTTYPPQTSTEYPVYSLLSYAAVTYPEPYSPPVLTGTTAEPYHPSASTESSAEPHILPEQNKNTPYSLQDTPSSDSAPYYPHASTEAPYYPPASTRAPYYPPTSTEAPYYFPPSYSDGFEPEPYDPPAPIYNVPASYSSPSLPSYNFPFYSIPSFMKSADHFPSDYEDAVYPSPNHRTSTHKPSPENEDFLQPGSFPRFNEFLQLMLRGKM